MAPTIPPRPDISSRASTSGARHLIEIGFWRIENVDEARPDPKGFVDLTWAIDERVAVAEYLAQRGAPVAWEGGPVEFCAFCGALLVVEPFTDGAYIWPAYLVHYVREHGIRLPQQFVDHVLSEEPRDSEQEVDVMNSDELVVEPHERDGTWWNSHRSR